MTRSYRPRLTLALVSLAVFAAGIVSVCIGAEFSDTGSPNTSSGGSSTDAGTDGGSANGAVGNRGGTVKCKGPEDCDDGDPCSVDECDSDGACKHSAKCSEVPGRRRSDFRLRCS